VRRGYCEGRVSEAGEGWSESWLIKAWRQRIHRCTGAKQMVEEGFEAVLSRKATGNAGVARILTARMSQTDWPGRVPRPPKRKRALDAVVETQSSGTQYRRAGPAKHVETLKKTLYSPIADRRGHNAHGPNSASSRHAKTDGRLHRCLRDPNYPLGGLDETSKQLHRGDARAIPMKTDARPVRLTSTSARHSNLSDVCTDSTACAMFKSHGSQDPQWITLRIEELGDMHFATAKDNRSVQDNLKFTARRPSRKPFGPPKPGGGGALRMAQLQSMALVAWRVRHRRLYPQCLELGFPTRANLVDENLRMETTAMQTTPTPAVQIHNPQCAYQTSSTLPSID